jgi:cytochrome c oxidase assembly factor CtaG
MVIADILLALGFFSPLQYWAMIYQWVHMIWHLDLMVFAPPFVVMADPWHEIRRGFPAGVADGVARYYRRIAAMRWVGPIASKLTSGWAALVAFDAAMWIWHLPGPFDWAMKDQGRMELMMFSFFLSGLFLWYTTLDSSPMRHHESTIIRVSHMVLASMSCMLLAMFLGLSSGPWYSAYNIYMGKLRTLSLLADQQFAAGILWVFGAVPWFIAGVVTLRDWLAEDETRDLGNAFKAFTLRKVRPAN